MQSCDKKTFGYEDEIIGSNITTLMPERYRWAHQNGMNRYLNTGIPKIIGSTVEVVGMKRMIPSFRLNYLYRYGGLMIGVIFTGIICDITERKQWNTILLRPIKT